MPAQSGNANGKVVVVTPMQVSEDGVFFFKNGFASLILELREGRFRYWQSSDISIGDEPTYPLTGEYTTNGPTICLQHQHRRVQKEWTFRKLNGETTLWRPNAIAWWSNKRTYDYFGVLYATALKPEDIWRKGVWKGRP